MSWMQKLAETYDECRSARAYSSEEGKRPLLPICHITAQADIEIVLDKDGNFCRARIITDKKYDATTIIPCTEGSASRSGKKPECHPLCDNLQYVAGDFTMYGGTVTSGFVDDPEEPHRNYTKALSDWCSSEFSHPKAQAVLKYIKKKKLIKDLAEHEILFERNGRLLQRKERKRAKNSPSDIFDVIASQGDAFVRWQVEIPGENETKVWKDDSLWDSWIRYYLATMEKGPLCYVTGRDSILSSQHPKYIRAKGDGAKLVSSNDTSGFTFRGRFLTAEQACNVSLEVSQKAHNALIWLVDRQGKVFWVKGDNGRAEPGLTVVAWAASQKRIPQPTEDFADILGFADLASDEPASSDTAQVLALKLRKKILGYNAELGETNDVQVMAMDSASKGRLAITYYRELKGSDYLERIDRWHQECAWVHNYRFEKTMEGDGANTKIKYYTFVGAPAPSDIAEAAYATNKNGKFEIDDKLRKTTVGRLLACIIDGQPIPRDILESAVRRASNRLGLEDWQFNKTLSIACALFKKHMIGKENYDMALDPNRKTRDYLYGRLLAIADRLEEVALWKAKEKRATNAARYMNQFAQHPYRTWNQIHSSLTPYIMRLGGATYYKNLIADVNCLFDPVEDFTSDKPLTGEYLLGYYCQRAELWPKTKEEAPVENEDINDNEQNSNNN